MKLNNVYENLCGNKTFSKREKQDGIRMVGRAITAKNIV